MRIDVVAPGELSQGDIATWGRLQAADPALASPYLSPDWTLACAAVDGPDRTGARVVVLREGDEAVGFLPVRCRGFTARPVGAPMCDYQGLVARPGLSLDPRALLPALDVGRLDFTHMLVGQPAFAPFAQGRSASHVIDVSEGYEAYAAERRESGRSILRDTAKKLRKLEREHDPVVFTALSDRAEALDRMIALKRDQYRLTRQTDIFEAGWPLELLRKLFATRDERFGGALFTLEVEGRPVAMHFALRAPGVLHSWFIAHDPDYERFSPGVGLIDQILRWAPANGVRELDLGPGEYRFKRHLANRTREVAHGYVGRLSPQALVRGAQYTVRAAAEALPLGRVSALPGKAMRRMDVISGLRA